MISVIKPGTKNRVECEHCGAILAYQKDDIQEHSYDTPFRPSGYTKYIICPQCCGKVVLEATK